MKIKTILYFIVGVGVSDLTLACGGSDYSVEIALGVSVLVIYACSLAIPIGGMLFSQYFTKGQIINTAIFSSAGTAVSLWVLFGSNSDGGRALGIVLASISMAAPSAYYLYKAIRYYVGNRAENA